MAKGPRLSHERAAALLDSVREDIARLPLAEQRWRDPSRSPLDRERDQQAAYHEWQAMVERFDLLAGACLASNLPPDQVQPFTDLVDALHKLLPTLERLGLQRPSMELMDQLATRLARRIA